MAATIINQFGVMQGWSSIIVNVMGRDLVGITQISYSDSMEKENVYGASGYPVGRSRGNYSAECALTIYKEEADALMLSLPLGVKIQDIAPFDIVVEYATPLGQIFKDRIRNCEFTNNGVDISQGDGTIATQFTLVVSNIDFNVLF